MKNAETNIHKEYISRSAAYSHVSLSGVYIFQNIKYDGGRWGKEKGENCIKKGKCLKIASGNKCKKNWGC